MLYCQLTSNVLNYPNVERFLQDFKLISMKKDEKLKEEVKKIINNISYDYFCDSIKLLIRFYRKMVVTIKDTTLPLFITKFQETTRTQCQEAVKNYKHRKQSTVLKQPETDPSTISMLLVPIEASQKRNNLSSNDNVGIMMNKLLNNNNKDLDLVQWSPSSLFTLDLNENPNAVTTVTKTGGETNSRKRKNDENDDNDASSTTNKTRPTTKHNTSPRKTVHLDPKFERITSITKQDDIDLKQIFATLFNSYEHEQVVESFSTQKQILELCLRLKVAIQNNFDNETNPTKGNREGFHVSYSKAMGYHSKTGKLNGFTIKSVSHGKNLYIHDFNEEKRKAKLTLWEQDIWSIGLNILHLTGYNEGISDNVCMQFGFMLPGDYVVKVRYLCPFFLDFKL